MTRGCSNQSDTRRRHSRVIPLASGNISWPRVTNGSFWRRVMVGQVKRGGCFAQCAAGRRLDRRGASRRRFADRRIPGTSARPFYVGSDKAFIGTGYDWSGVGRRARIPSKEQQLETGHDDLGQLFHHRQSQQAKSSDDPSGTMPKVRFYRTDGSEWRVLGIRDCRRRERLPGNTHRIVRPVGRQTGETPPGLGNADPLAKRHEATNYLSYTDNDVFIFGEDSPPASPGCVSDAMRSTPSTPTQPGLDLRHTGGLEAHEAQTESGDSGGPSFSSVE